jgi:hypothetical protein
MLFYNKEIIILSSMIVKQIMLIILKFLSNSLKKSIYLRRYYNE